MSKMSAIRKYRAARWLYLHHCEPLAWLIRSFIYLVHNSYIPYTCEIGRGTEFGYKGIGLVIHSYAKIGEDCLISTGVTIGGRSGYQKVPVIGNRVEICTGAKILGPVTIGDDSIIGANAVVIQDVPPKTITFRRFE